MTLQLGCEIPRELWVHTLYSNRDSDITFHATLTLFCCINQMLFTLTKGISSLTVSWNNQSYPHCHWLKSHLNLANLLWHFCRIRIFHNNKRCEFQSGVQPLKYLLYKKRNSEFYTRMGPVISWRFSIVWHLEIFIKLC